MQHKVHELMEKGVFIPNPETVLIGDEVDVNRISGSGTEIYPGCKIFGEQTLILDKVKIGYESPVTIENCPYLELGLRGCIAPAPGVGTLAGIIRILFRVFLPRYENSRVQLSVSSF